MIWSLIRITKIHRAPLFFPLASEDIKSVEVVCVCLLRNLPCKVSNYSALFWPLSFLAALTLIEYVFGSILRCSACKKPSKILQQQHCTEFRSSILKSHHAIPTLEWFLDAGQLEICLLSRRCHEGTSVCMIMTNLQENVARWLIEKQEDRNSNICSLIRKWGRQPNRSATCNKNYRSLTGREGSQRDG